MMEKSLISKKKKKKAFKSKSLFVPLQPFLVLFQVWVNVQFSYITVLLFSRDDRLSVRHPVRMRSSVCYLHRLVGTSYSRRDAVVCLWRFFSLPLLRCKNNSTGGVEAIK